ncbi:MAG TPA: TetR/AcrR family transcriptional regulator [Methylomirabilota bacterium]|nr:TetR/AcrR family transcriptional regulator [Methylomirabilota bacterium]
MARRPARPKRKGPRAATGRRRGRYHHGNLPRALVDAALRLVEREGAEALTLRGAARLAGVSQAAPYRHFADKQALLAAVAEEGFRAMTDAMRRASTAHAGDPLGRFRALGLAYIEFATTHRAHFRVMFGRAAADRSVYPSLEKAAGETFGLLVEAIRDCQRAGLVHPGDPDELALAAWSGTHGLSSLAVDGQLALMGGRPLETLTQAVMANIFFGLGSR